MILDISVFITCYLLSSSEFSQFLLQCLMTSVRLKVLGCVSSGRWKYSFNSIMEVHIKRVSRMWSWSNIRRHRENLKDYKKAYKTKLTSSKQNQENDLHIQVRHTRGAHSL